MQHNSILKSDKNFLFIYLPLKITIVFSLFIFLEISNLRFEFLNYPDFNRYSDCFKTFDNFLFGISACVMNIKDTSSLLPIVITFMATIMRDFLYIKICSKLMLNDRITILFSVLLALHPYLAIYSLKFTTDLFGSLGVLLIFYQIAYNKNNHLLFVLALILIFFRNNLVLVFSLYYIIQLLISYFISSRADIKKYLIYLFLIFCCWLSLTSSIYLESNHSGFIFDDKWPFSLPNHLAFFGFESTLFTNIFGLFSLFISHLILLTGFRESVFLYGFSYLFTNGIIFGISQLIVSLVLSIIHIIGSIYFFYFNRNKKYLVILIYVIPTFIALSHLRYFYPIIPIALLGFSILIDNIITRLENYKSK